MALFLHPFLGIGCPGEKMTVPLESQRVVSYTCLIIIYYDAIIRTVFLVTWTSFKNRYSPNTKMAANQPFCIE